MKLIIQIPCYNEEATLAITLADLPREVPGFDSVEWLIIDDGSGDRTSEVARSNGVDHVVHHTKNLGLAQAFLTGLDASVNAGADVIVNTDADNQYCAADIPKLVQPILNGKADMVIGARPIDDIQHFSPLKKFFQKLGSSMVRVVSNTDIPDAPSGFRAMTRKTALHLNVFNEYTYTLETIIQAGHKGIAVTSVPIRTNEDLRPSRLVKTIPSYIRRSMVTMLRIFVIYRPMRFFFYLGSIPMAGGVALALRWLYFLIYTDTTRTRLPSLLAAAVLALIGFHIWTLGILADLFAANRKIVEETQARVRMIKADLSAHSRDETA